MKQTFVQKFKPVSREQIAAALTEIAEQLRLPEQPDPDQHYWFITEELSFDLSGKGTHNLGSIRLITNL